MSMIDEPGQVNSAHASFMEEVESGHLDLVRSQKTVIRFRAAQARAQPLTFSILVLLSLAAVAYIVYKRLSDVRPKYV